MYLTLLCNSSELEDWACNRQEKDSNSADMGQQASVTKVSGHAIFVLECQRKPLVRNFGRLSRWWMVAAAGSEELLKLFDL